MLTAATRLTVLAMDRMSEHRRLAERPEWPTRCKGGKGIQHAKHTVGLSCKNFYLLDLLPPVQSPV